MNELRRRVMNAEVGGMKAVDLGLPSGKLWAECNIGANSPEEEGMFFSWGDTIGHYYSEGYRFTQTNYENGVSGSGHNLTNFITTNETYDPAMANLGGTWRVPTTAEYRELFANTNKESVSNYEGTGVSGVKFTSKADSSKYIFFPNRGNVDDTTRRYNGQRAYYDEANGGGQSRYYCYVNNSNDADTAKKWLGIQVRAICTV